MDSSYIHTKQEQSKKSTSEIAAIEDVSRDDSRDEGCRILYANHKERLALQIYADNDHNDMVGE